jgi:tetratricopeptide (TPR) repeat protein
MIENTLRIKEAAEFIKSKNYEKAIKILDVELEENPTNIYTFYFKGIAQTYLGIILKEKDLIFSGIQYFKKLIASKGENPYQDFSDVETKLDWAKNELKILEQL